MHWISLYDCVLLALLALHVIRPGNGYFQPAMLLSGFILKEVVMANPLLVTRLIVLFISVVQVYVLLPLVRLWERCRNRRTASQARSQKQAVHITCMHDAQEAHHVSTSGVLCPNCSAYRVQYTWKDHQYSMLLPPAQSPRDMIEQCMKETARPHSSSRVTWKPPMRVSAVWWVSEGERVLDLLPAMLEVLGPDMDGHAKLSRSQSLRVRPLSVLVWMATSNTDACDPCRLPQDNPLVFDLEIEYRTGEVSACRVTEALFSVTDLVMLCRGLPGPARA